MSKLRPPFKATGSTRKLLRVIGELQTLIGAAKNYHQNDRDPGGFEKGQKSLDEAFRLCIDTTGQYERVGDD